MTRLASKETFSPSNKIHREVGRAKDLSAPLYIYDIYIYIYIYITILAPNEIFSPSNKIHREVGRGKDLSAPLYIYDNISLNSYCHTQFLPKTFQIVNMLRNHPIMYTPHIISYSAIRISKCF